MIETLQWCTLGICGLVAAARVPSALRGNNRTLFYIFALITLAILLSIEAPYVAIDRALGGLNVANLILRLVIFATIYFVGIRIAKGFGATGAYRLITGRMGMVALGLTSLIVLVFFLMMDTAGSSAGLVSVSVKDSRNGLLVEYYGAAGRAYPAYVSLVLLPAMASAVRGTLPGLVRVSAFLLAVGSAAVGLTLLFPLIPPESGFVEAVINYTAVLCFVMGLAVIGVAGVVYRRRDPRQKTSTAK
ncbi:hypothetical protein [Pseudarthrobacter sp. IC2-21]|jgi:hypothetical protein|uniref:hypothetical protein n=1 Tax=Pseudarthrobacter sp. IC2-21 TaxID=3092262 RepID=UPI002A6A0572|nr:hypothetical protein [Pseudarthrobacter sp. IC2-21]